MMVQAGASQALITSHVVLQRAQNKDRMLLLFARVGYVPCLEELLSMGADPASKVAPLGRARGRV